MNDLARDQPDRAHAAAATPPRSRAARFGLTTLLTLLVAMGPISTDLYLPSLPGIAADLEAPDALVQLTVGLFIGGFAVMMLVSGPLADRFGRRPIVMGGLALFTAASIACALSPSIGVLLAARFVQALGACVGPVIGRAIIRDLYAPRDAGRVLGYMASAMALAPLVAPFIGGYLEVAFGWRACFWFLAGFGLLLLTALWRHLPETLRAPLPGAFSPKALLGNYALIVRDRTFLGFMLAMSLTFGALFSWISNASFVVIDHFGVAPERFGFAFGVVVVGYILGAYGGSRLGMRLDPLPTTTIGCAIAAVAGIGLAVAGWSGLGGLHAIVLLTALTFVGTGIVIPQGTAGALAPFPDRAGSAAALLGFVQMMTGLLVGVLSSAAFDGTPRPMVTLNAVCAVLALVSIRLVFSRRRGA